MPAHKTDIDESYIVLYHGYQTKIIPLDVENIPLIPDVIHCPERLLHIREGLPFTSLYDHFPVLQGYPRLWVLLAVGGQCLLGKNPHLQIHFANIYNYSK